MDRTTHPNATRFELIDSNGRAIVRHFEPGMEVHIQDDGRTIKVFAGRRAGVR